MSDETYEGYKNRETWAFEVNWANAQPVYLWVLAQAQEFLRSMPEATDYDLGKHIIDAVQEEARNAKAQADDFLHASEMREFYKSLAIMRDDVGSWWRVDQAEVGESIRDSLDQEDMLP